MYLKNKNYATRILPGETSIFSQSYLAYPVFWLKCKCMQCYLLIQYFAPFIDTFAMEVESGRTYLLRIINAALNDELFFAIAGHSLTVVEVDAVYTKPFTTQSILIAPGQTTNVLVQANQKPGRYFMAARPFMDAPIPVDNKTATGIFQYKGIPNTFLPTLPQLPAPNDTESALSYNKKLRSLNTPQFLANVPQKVDRKLFYTIGFGKDSCPACVNGTRLLATLNNISFVMPETALLQAHYFNLKGVFKADFPDKPPKAFNYTGAPLTANLGTARATRLSKIAFNSTVELVLQDTNLLTVESHPFHLHGYNFFVVGTGIGNFDPVKDPAEYNLVDPIERNTVGVPTGGWTAIRFRADNPGIYSSQQHPLSLTLLRVILHSMNIGSTNYVVFPVKVFGSCIVIWSSTLVGD